jgi:hypothetical protein
VWKNIWKVHSTPLLRSHVSKACATCHAQQEVAGDIEKGRNDKESASEQNISLEISGLSSGFRCKTAFWMFCSVYDCVIVIDHGKQDAQDGSLPSFHADSWLRATMRC